AVVQPRRCEARHAESANVVKAPMARAAAHGGVELQVAIARHLLFSRRRAKRAALCSRPAGVMRPSPAHAHAIPPHPPGEEEFSRRLPSALQRMEPLWITFESAPASLPSLIPGLDPRSWAVIHRL